MIYIATTTINKPTKALKLFAKNKNCRLIVALDKKSKKFDMTLSLAAKQRSIHNNYSTFLVLFIMLSGHFSFLVYHKYNWAILVLIGIISGLARHYFNLRGRNIHKISFLYISIIALIILAGIIFIFKT